ncbi:MAG: TIGR02587 family membrane protein [Chloroflexota bacterium]|nr:TIGR02587 family membrane protein [Chloroflexota bacterium]
MRPGTLDTPTGERAPAGSREEQFWTGILRGFGGALLFSLPILLTMEMWWLGFYAYRWRLVLFLLVIVPVLVGLARYAGIRSAPSWTDDCIDAMTAYGIGFVASALVLPVLGIVTWDMPLREIVGKIAVQAPPAAFGAILARAQLGGTSPQEEEEKARSGYPAELFFVAAGAFYLGATVAATEEMVTIAYRMTPWHAMLLLAAEVLIMHVFLYSMRFHGAPEVPADTPWWSLLVRLTIPGYVLTLAVAAYILWTFGRFEGLSLHWLLMYTLVLGLPCTVGGAAGRLIL